MKEFHEILAKTENKLQFFQLCKDSWVEMKQEKVQYMQAVAFLDTYYTMDWNYTQLKSFAMFIRSGAFISHLELYR